MRIAKLAAAAGVVAAFGAMGACASGQSAEPAYTILRENVQGSFIRGEIDEVRIGPDDSLILEDRPNTFYRAKLIGPCLSEIYGPYAPVLDSGPGGGISRLTRVSIGGRECTITQIDEIANPRLAGKKPAEAAAQPET